MTGSRSSGPLLVEWGWAGAALEGESVSGDVHVVAPFPGGVLVAVIDGLGHGVEAADASRQAAAVLEGRAGDPVDSLVERCHQALRKTRGAVMSVASIDERTATLSWIAVGNVEALLLRGRRGVSPARESVTMRGGVVGYQLPALRTSSHRVSPGDTLVMATDGIRSGFVADVDARDAPQAIATAIFTRHARGSDDALVVAARYVGATP